MWVGRALAVDRDADANGNWEIWPNLLEAAYRAWIGWADLNNGGDTATAWQHLTGRPAEILSTNDFTAGQLRTRIEEAWNAGKKIVLDTWGKDKKDNWNLPGNHRDADAGERLPYRSDTSDLCSYIRVTGVARVKPGDVLVNGENGDKGYRIRKIVPANAKTGVIGWVEMDPKAIVGEALAKEPRAIRPVEKR
ncbi:MAG: hypothetical protein NZO58_07000 [Gemmataceae bacterium]|nr:hypothetical protein [Gemmataceae bacterium]